MSNENQIGTLEEMTKESFTNRPNQAPEAIEEYISNLKEEDAARADSLQNKLNSSEKYLEQFKVAITHTSLMVFLMSIKASNLASANGEKNEVQQLISEIEVDLNKYIREFMLFSQKDDKEIYDMRLFYLNGLTGSELGLDYVDVDSFESKEEAKQAVEKAKLQSQKYDELLNSFKAKYMETKLHLQ